MQPMRNVKLMKTGSRWPTRKTCLMVTLTCLTLAACGLEEESTVTEESEVTSSEGAATEAERDGTLDTSTTEDLSPESEPPEEDLPPEGEPSALYEQESPGLTAPFIIRSYLNGKCLDIQGANRNNGAHVIMWDCHGRANQQWYWDNSQIKSRLNNKCLDIQGANRNNGAHIIMWDCHGGANQKWNPHNPLVKSRLNNKCLDIQGANRNNGAHVIMWSCHGGANQKWY